LNDVDRHELSKQWAIMSRGYDPAQFHVTRNGLALLAACLIHLIDVLHATVPT
jgi:hypothetical protein